MNGKVLKEEFIDSEVFEKWIKDVNREGVIKEDLKRDKRKYGGGWKGIEYMSFGVVIWIYDNVVDGGLKDGI